MSKKPTRRKAQPKEVASTGSGEALGSAPESTEVEEEAAAKQSTRLPAFGFAEDLLGKSSTKGKDQAPAEDSAESKPEDRTNQAAAAAGGATSTDPERIFRFADSLGGASAEHEQAAVRRLGTWVSFALAGETFALPVEPVREVVRVSSITRVPHAPKPIRGVTNLRGRVIPVIDLRLRIDLPPTEFERTTRIIVVAARGRLIGLLVDAVEQVVHLDLDQVHPPPDDVMTMQSDYISGVYHLDDHLVLLLNVERALVVRGAEELADASANTSANTQPAL